MGDQPAQDDPLDLLFVDRESLDKALLAELILPYVRLQKGSSEIIPTEQWKELNLSQKVLVYLLSRKARVSKGLDGEEKTTPAEIERDTGIGGNSVRPTLSRLLDENLVKLDKATKGYFVPNFALPNVKARLKKGNEK